MVQILLETITEPKTKIKVRKWNKPTIGGYLRAVNPAAYHVQEIFKEALESYGFSLFQDPTTNFPSDCNLDTNDVVYCRK